MNKKRAYPVMWAAFVILLLSGLYLGLQAWLKEDLTGGLNPVAYRLSISARHTGEALPVYKVMQDQTFTLAIRSDRPGELDVHGYEKKKKIDVEPGSEVILTFTVEHAGLFPLHLHEPLDPRQPDGAVNHRHLATFEVQAR